MQKGKIMESLETDGGHKAGLDIIVIEVIGHEHEYRPDAFASERKNIADRGIESLRLSFKWQFVDGIVHDL